MTTRTNIIAGPDNGSSSSIVYPTVTAEIIEVTPGLAIEWLGKNVRNRKFKDTAIKTYANDMAAGNWSMTGEPVKFDKYGTLLDGQNRLMAVIEAHLVIPMMVVYGLEPDTQDVMDTGVKRAASDALTMRGYKYTKVMSAAATLAINWEKGLFTTATQRVIPRVSHSEILAFLDENPAFLTATNYLGGGRRGFRAMGARGSVGVFCYWALSEVDIAAATVFVEDLAEMRTQGGGDPRNTLLHRFRTAKDNNEHMSQVTEAYYVFRAWRAVRANQSLSQLKGVVNNRAMPFPQPGEL